MKAFFQDIASAVKDFKFYRQAKDFEVSRALKYIFLLVFSIALVLTVKYSFDFKRGLNKSADWAKKNLPVIEIKDGVVSVDVKQPYEVIEDGFALVIDTTGEITSLDGYEKGVLLTKNKVMYRENDVKTESYDLSNVKSLRIDENFMNALKNNIVWMIFPFMLLGIFIFSCIARFLQIFIFSLVSLGVSSTTNAKLNYKQLINVGIYAITPAAILGALAAFFGVAPPFFGFLYAGTYIAYLVISIRSCKE